MQPLTFEAVLHSIETGDEKNLATFYLMNTSPNRLGWGVTDKALEDALPTLLKQKMTIGCGPDYKTDRHYEHPIPVGKWVSFNKPNGYALATAEITDLLALRNLKSGKWGPISVVIESYKETSENGDDVVESFTFKTVDFVDVPAFPQAGFLNFAGLRGLTVVNPIELCASFYESQSTGQAPGSPGSNLNPTESEKKLTKEKIEQLQNEIKELEASMKTLTDDMKTLTDDKKTLTAANTDLEEKVKTLENPDENPDIAPLKEEIKTLTEKLAGIEAEKHQDLLTACVEARFKAGLSTDKAADSEALKDFSDEMLKFNTLEAGKVEEMKKASLPSGPQLKYTPENKTELQAAIDGQREDFGFPVRELEAAE